MITFEELRERPDTEVTTDDLIRLHMLAARGNAEAKLIIDFLDWRAEMRVRAARAAWGYESEPRPLPANVIPFRRHTNEPPGAA